MFWRTQFEAAEVGVIAPLRPSGASPPDSTAYLPHEAQLQEHPSSHLVSKTSSFRESPLLLGACPPSNAGGKESHEGSSFCPLCRLPFKHSLHPYEHRADHSALLCQGGRSPPLTSSRIVFLMLRAFVALK